MIYFENLPSAKTPVNAKNLNKMQLDILKALGLDEDDWSSEETYEIGDMVVDSNCIYKNTTGVNTETRPSEDSTNWVLVPLLVDEEEE